MKKYIILTVWLTCLNFFSFSQNEFYNGGSLIHVQNGADIFVQGEVKNASGTLVNEGQIELIGNWSNTGSYQADITGEVIFSGTGLSSVSGNMTGNNDFYKLRVNKTGTSANAKRILLNTSIHVDHSLTLSNGRITTGSHEVYVTNGSLSAITGYAPAGVASNSQYVEGNLRRRVNSTGSYYDFPVGISPGGLGYQLVRMRMQQLSSTSSVLARFQSAAPTPANVSECGPFYDCVLGTHGEWVLAPNQGSPVYDLLAVPRKFSTDCGAGTYTLQLGSQLLGDPCIVYTGLPNPLSGTEIPRTGLNTFAPIAVTGSGGVLPVELLTFEGKKEGETVVLDWLTDHEINNDYFGVERSSDGNDFYIIGEVKGKGTTDQISEYQLVDQSPLAGKSYYRLKQVDFDGKYTLSNIVEINFDNIDPLIQIRPNPFSDYVEIYWPNPDKGKLVLYTLHGQEISTYHLTQSITQIDVVDLASGIYYYRVKQGGVTLREGKLVKK